MYRKSCLSPIWISDTPPFLPLCPFWFPSWPHTKSNDSFIFIVIHAFLEALFHNFASSFLSDALILHLLDPTFLDLFVGNLSPTPILAPLCANLFLQMGLKNTILIVIIKIFTIINIFLIIQICRASYSVLEASLLSFPHLFFTILNISPQTFS